MNTKQAADILFEAAMEHNLDMPTILSACALLSSFILSECAKNDSARVEATASFVAMVLKNTASFVAMG